VALLAKRTESMCTAAGKANAVCFLRPRYVGGGEANDHTNRACLLSWHCMDMFCRRLLLRRFRVQHIQVPVCLLDACSIVAIKGTMSLHKSAISVERKPNLTHGSKHFCFGRQRTTSRSGWCYHDCMCFKDQLLICVQVKSERAERADIGSDMPYNRQIP
jgi:hypothetical protein